MWSLCTGANLLIGGMLLIIARRTTAPVSSPDRRGFVLPGASPGAPTPGSAAILPR